MELQQLRYVLAVNDTRNFTRAAERCFVVQSALSQQVKALERELGCPLFARSSRKVELTPAGAAFVPWARVCVDAARQAAEHAAAASGIITGDVRIGAIPAFASVDLPSLLAQFHAAHSHVGVQLRSAGSDALAGEVAKGDLDLAFIGTADGVTFDGVRQRELQRQPLVAVLPPGHRLGGRRDVSLAEIADERFVDFPAGSPGRVQSDIAFRRAGLTRQVGFEVGSTDLLLGLVERGLGVGFLVAEAIPRGSAVGVARLADGPVRVEQLAWRDFNPSPATQALLSLLLDGEDASPESVTPPASKAIPSSQGDLRPHR